MSSSGSGRFNLDKRPFDISEFIGNTEQGPNTVTYSSQYDSLKTDIFASSSSIPMVVHILALIVLVISVILIGYSIIRACIFTINIIQRTIKQLFHKIEIYEYAINTLS